MPSKLLPSVCLLDLCLYPLVNVMTELSVSLLAMVAHLNRQISAVKILQITV